MSTAAPTAAIPEPHEEPQWQVAARALDLDGWRTRLVLDGNGDGWLGGSLSERRSRDLLWQLAGDGLRPAALPAPASRAFVLDVDRTGGLWVAAYDPDDASTYDGLTIAWLPSRANAGDDGATPIVDGTSGDSDGPRPSVADDWVIETVSPGLWPQTMAMTAPDAGWIGGNNARLLQRTAAGWRPARIVLEPGAEPENLNVIDLELSPGGGLLVGSRGLVATLDGDVWRQVEVPAVLAGRYLYALDLTADGAGWIAAGGGYIARWHEAAGWRIERPTTFSLLGIDMVSDDEGWAVGAAGTILARRQGSWRPVASPVAADLHDVAMQDPAHGWIAGIRLLLRGKPGRAAASLVERTPAILAERSALGAAVADVDGDDALDLILAGLDEVRIFPRRAEGFRAGSVLPRPDSPYADRRDGWGVGDVDGNGGVDLLLLGEHGADRHLYLNDGSGGFSDATAAAGLGPFLGQGNAAYPVDLDADGALDLYVARGWLSGSLPLVDELYVNDGLGRFEPRRLSAGGAAFAQVVLWGDLDGDGLMDAVIPGYDPTEARLYRNDGGVLVDATAQSGLRVATWEVNAGVVADLEGDGDLDLVLVGDELEIHRNDGFGHGGRFNYATSVASGAVDARAVFCRAGDLDHDGRLELLAHWRGVGVASTLLLARAADGRYLEVGGAGGTASPLAGLGPMEDAVLADLDGDGDLDPLLTGRRGTVLLQGRLDDRRWLRVRLRGHRGSIEGSTVRVSVANASDRPGPLIAHLQAAPGSGVLGEVHTGLGGAAAVDVEVRFPGPDNRPVVYRDVPAGSLLEVHDTAMPWRLLVRGQRAVARRLAAVDPAREALKLGAVMAAFALLGATIGRRPAGSAAALVTAGSGAIDLRRHAQRRVVAGSAFVLLVLHPAVSLALAPVRSSMMHWGQVAGMAGLAAWLLTLERRFAARHLGAYRLGALLGEGGMGVVHRARHVVRGHEVALKLLHPHLLRDETSRLRFLREARLMAAASHPALIRVEEAGEIDGRGFIAMELLEGCSLACHLSAYGPLPTSAWRALAVALAEALAALHEQRIVHRDLKSENVFVLDRPADGWSRRVRLMDLGLAWSESQATLTRQRALVGTVATMAPERLQGAGADRRSDLWSLGAVLYEAATGQPPFGGGEGAALVHAILHRDPTPPRQLSPALPSPHEALILALLARDPAGRPGSAAAVAEALRAAAPARGPRTLPQPAVAPAAEAAASRQASHPARSSSSAEWLALYASAQAHFTAGRLSQADVALVACLQALRHRAARLDRCRRAAYLARRDVRSVLELSRRLELDDPRRRSSEAGGRALDRGSDH